MTSGGSLPQGVPSPQKVASLRPRASGLLGFAQKLRVLFGGPSLHSSVRLRRTRHSGQKSRLCADRSGVPLLYAPCLSPSGLPPSGGETGTVFPVLSTRRRHLAGRVPRAKRLGRRRRNPGPRNLHTAYIIYLMEPGTATGRQWRRASSPEKGRGIRELRKKGRRNPGRCREPVQRRAAFRLSDRATARTA